MPLINSDKKIHVHPDGKKFLRVDSSCLEKDISLLRSGDFFGAMIGRIHGYALDDVEFLKEIPDLQGVHIQDEIPNVSAVNAMTQLKYLLMASPSNTIDVSKFPVLRELRVVGWNANLIRIEESVSLEILYVNQFSPGKSGISILAPGSGLKELEIVQSSVSSLDGLERFAQLSALTLRYCTKLEDISQLQCLRKSLRKLILDCNKRISDFAPVGALTHLENLSISGCGKVPSIGFVRTLRKLETIGLMSGTTIVDGDLEPLLSLPHLRFAAVDNKKHYSHTASALKQALESRS